MNKGYRVSIVDDNKVFRDGLRFFIETQTNWEILQEASSGIEFLEAERSDFPDIVFMDINMPLLNGMKTIQEFFAKYARYNVKVIGITMYSSEYQLQSLIEAGFSACVLKKDVYNCLKLAVDKVMSNGMYFNKFINVNK